MDKSIIAMELMELRNVVVRLSRWRPDHIGHDQRLCVNLPVQLEPTELAKFRHREIVVEQLAFIQVLPTPMVVVLQVSTHAPVVHMLFWALARPLAATGTINEATKYTNDQRVFIISSPRSLRQSCR